MAKIITKAIGILSLGMLAGVACGVTDDSNLPPDVQDPSITKTPAGALARYREALAEIASVVDGVMFTSGVLTDELASLPVQLGTTGLYGSLANLDSRQDPSGVSLGQSDRLHRLRAQAREARGFLNTYAPESSPALRGHLYALEAYAEIFLADLFCSGIPLSTVDFDGNYTLAAGSTTSEVYTHAIELLDSALGFVSDSVRLQRLAAVGKGRALLALNRYAEAAAVVAGVPDDFRYQVVFTYRFTATSVGLVVPDSAALPWLSYRANVAGTNTVTALAGAPSVANQEGGTGLNYRLSGDPRVQSVQRGRDPLANSRYHPSKYPAPSSTTSSFTPMMITVADGIEARLIEAEAALYASPGDGRWLNTLNHLRQTAWPSIVPAVSGPLADLVDPGTPEARVDLMFRERAFWLYLTAHRQGDLRRLVRQYLRSPDTVYPTGAYPGGPGFYGTEVVIPVPERERQLNPKYAGCFHRNA